MKRVQRGGHEKMKGEDGHRDASEDGRCTQYVYENHPPNVSESMVCGGGGEAD